MQAQQEHGRFDFPFTVNGQEHVLTYEGTHDVMRQPDPAVKLVVFVHHGGSQNPVTYFKHMKTALDAAAADRPGLNLPGTTMIIAPGMIGDQHIKDNPKRYAGKNYPHWDGGWREGEPSLSKPQVSNFDLLDGMVLHIADRYPNVKAIVHVGHSAGGQLLSRYSFGTPVYDVLRARGIYVRYVIANPSSVLYFDRQRPDLVAGKGFVDYRSRTPVLAEGECKEFNTYKYGLDGMVPYMTRRPVAAMLASFRKRDVFLLTEQRTSIRWPTDWIAIVPACCREGSGSSADSATTSTSAISSDPRSTRTSSWSWLPASRTPAARCSGARPANRSSSSMQTARRQRFATRTHAVRLRNSRWSSTAVVACAIVPNSPPNLDSRKPIATG